MLLLVFAHGDEIGLMDEDIHSHKSGISEEAGVHALVGLVAYYLLLDLVAVAVDSEGLARLVLEGSGAHQLPYPDVHVHQKIHLGNLRYVALHVNIVFLRIKTGGEVLGEDVLYILVEHLRVGMSGERMQVCHEITAVIVVLHLDKLAEGTEIVAEMKIASGTYAAEHHFLFILVFLFHNQSLVILCKKGAKGQNGNHSLPLSRISKCKITQI